MKNRYITFIKHYFPYFKIGKEKNFVKLYNLIYDNSIIFGTLKRSINNENALYFVAGFKEAIQKLLIVIPIKDEEVISYCIRLAADMSFKAIFSFVESDFSIVNSATFKKLKEETATLSRCKTEINRIANIFGEYSNYVHKKSMVNYSIIPDLASKLDGNQSNLSKLNNKLEDLMLSLYSVIIKLSGVTYEDLSFAEKSTLDEIKNHSISAKILELLKT